jgi:hypothetical protein
VRGIAIDQGEKLDNARDFTGAGCESVSSENDEGGQQNEKHDEQRI